MWHPALWQRLMAQQQPVIVHAGPAFAALVVTMGRAIETQPIESGFHMQGKEAQPVDSGFLHAKADDPVIVGTELIVVIFSLAAGWQLIRSSRMK